MSEIATPQTFGALLLAPQARALGLTYRAHDAWCWDGVVEGQGASLAHLGPVLDINRHLPSVRARNKSAASIILGRAGVRVPREIVVSATDADPEAIAAFLAVHDQCVLKPTHGTRGWGVALVETKEEVLGTIAHAQVDMHVLQERVRGREARVVVFRGRAISGYWRHHNGDGFGNLGQGASAEFFADVPRSLAAPARLATHELGLDLSGVDLMLHKDGSATVLEVNAAPNYGAAMQQPGGTEWSERTVREILRRRFRVSS